MGALCCCFRSSDEQDNHVVEDSGEFSHLKWYFQMFIRKQTVQAPRLHPLSQQSPPSNPGLILNNTNSSEVDNIAGDEDSCPTCFYEYTEEHPKIVMKCSHHYHLSCIYEWMERSECCPVCGEVISEYQLFKFYTVCQNSSPRQL